MASRKPHISRTYAPIHFDDLDPHRFEDLVRELIYDFRDWQTIEATGRAGSDDGFDIRAFEKAVRIPSPTDEDPAEEVHPMDGQRWMIQGKREKTIGPADIKKILEDVDKDYPPYGYILAASATFSKRSYDLFRDILREKGVMEFYIGGNAELEDMLHLPKNDRILFTFFGISLVSRRRSRTTEVRSAIIVKNRLYKIVGEPSDNVSKAILVRDINDVHYPRKDEILDFATHPRWAEREAFGHHPRGLLVHRRKCFAYVDRDAKEWDFTQDAHLLFLQFARDDERDYQNRKQIARIRGITDYLPRSKQGNFHHDALIAYDDILLVDAEGDGLYRCPHIYMDLSSGREIYVGKREYLSVDAVNIDISDDWKRVEYFKNAKPVEIRAPVSEEQRAIDLDGETLKGHVEHKRDAETLYAADDRYQALRVGDIVPLRGEHKGEKLYVRVTHTQKSTLADYLRHHERAWEAGRFATRQIGREIQDNEILSIVEVDRAYPRQWEDRCD